MNEGSFNALFLSSLLSVLNLGNRPKCQLLSQFSFYSQESIFAAFGRLRKPFFLLVEAISY